MNRIRTAPWWLSWLVAPLALGAAVSIWVDTSSLPLGGEHLTAVLLLDGQAYFGHLRDDGTGGTLLLRDVYYLQDSKGATTNLPVGLTRRGVEPHQPADGMRINREKVLAVERVGPDSAVAQAIAVDRAITGVSSSALSFLNPRAVADGRMVAAERVAAEHALARGYAGGVDTLNKLKELVLPVTAAVATAEIAKATDDLRGVRRSALLAIGRTIGMSAGDADQYVKTVDAALETGSFKNEPGTLLAPDLQAIVFRATDLYGQVADAAAKKITTK